MKFPINFVPSVIYVEIDKGTITNILFLYGFEKIPQVTKESMSYYQKFLQHILSLNLHKRKSSSLEEMKLRF